MAAIDALQRNLQCGKSDTLLARREYVNTIQQILEYFKQKLTQILEYPLCVQLTIRGEGGGGQMNMDFVRRRITELRVKKGISEKHLGELIGHSTGYIQNISSGRSGIPLPELFKLCELFDVSLKDFFDEELVAPPQRYATIEGVRNLSEEDYPLVRDLVKRLNGGKK